MGAILLREEWDKQPPFRSKIKREGFCRDVAFVFSPKDGYVDLSGQIPFVGAYSVTTALKIEGRTSGIGGLPVGGTSYAQTGETNFRRGYTLFAVACGSGTAYEAILDDDPGGTRGFQFRFSNTGQINFIPFTDADGFVSVTSDAFSATELAAGVAVCAKVDASGNISVFAKGKKYTGSLGAAPRIPGNVSTNRGIRIFQNKGGTLNLTKPLMFAGANYNVATDEECYSFLANPWQIFEPEEDYIFTTEGAGGGATISAEGIASAEVFGMPGISVGEVTVSPPSINSLETFGSTTVATSISISPSGIPSLESFGTPAISVGSVVLSPSGIASQEAFGIASIDNGSGVQTLVPIGISSLEAFGLSTVNPGPITLSPGSISSLEAFGTAIISSGEIILSPSAIATAEAFGLSVVTVGTTTILPIGIGSEENFGIAVIEGGEIIAINIYPRRLYYNYLGRH